MNTIYFDCFAGISGDMALGALIDLGADFDALKTELSKLDLDDEFKISSQKIACKCICATDVFVSLAKSKHCHRTFTDIKELIEKSTLSENVKQNAVGIFRVLGEAEAKVHGKDIEEIHFHEVGAIDSIVDIVGVCICLDMLSVEKVYSSAIPTFHGTVEIAHGVLPLPAPATIEILKNVPFRKADIEGEIVTPTGAAILKYFAESYGVMPSMNIKSVGYGAGKKDFGITNVIRAVYGELIENNIQKEEAIIRIVEANIDDLNPQIYEIVMEKAFTNGALDVYLTNIQMKKNRPAHLITILCTEKDIDKMADILFEETSTIGVRIDTRERICLNREIKIIETKYGQIKIKVAYKDGKAVNIQPEYEDIKTASQHYNISFKKLRDYVIGEYTKLYNP